MHLEIFSINLNLITFLERNNVGNYLTASFSSTLQIFSLPNVKYCFSSLLPLHSWHLVLIGNKLAVHSGFTTVYYMYRKQYANSFVNATFGSGKNSCYAKFVLTKLVK